MLLAPNELSTTSSYYPNSPSGNRASGDTPSVILGPVRRLIDKIGVKLGRPKAQISSPIPATPETASQIGVADITTVTLGENIWQIRNDRASVYYDLNRMDENDTLISTGLDVISECTTCYEDIEEDGFQWELDTVNLGAMKVLEDLKERLNLGMECYHIVRGYVKFGEEFREVVVNNNMEIVGFRSLPGQTMFPNMDERGNKTSGYHQLPNLNMPGNKIEFQEWQIVPFVYGPRCGWFGTGLMKPARRTWKRLDKMQDGMAIARLIRAYDKLVHRVPVRPEWTKERQEKAIGDYKARMTKVQALDNSSNVTFRNNPFTVETDIYLPDDGSNRGGVEVLDAKNTQLAQIQDVQHHQNLLLARLKVPRKFLNMGPGQKGIISDGSTAAEDVQFARTLRNVQAILRHGLYRLAWLALFLQGYDARALGLRIRMAKISTMDALMNSKVLFTKAQAAEIYAGLMGGLPPELLATRFMELDEDEQEVLEDFLVELEAEQAKADAEAAKIAAANGTNPGAPASNKGSSRPGADADGAVRSPEAKRRSMRRGIGRRAGRETGVQTTPRAQDDELPFQISQAYSRIRAVVDERQVDEEVPVLSAGEQYLLDKVENLIK